MTGGCPDAKNKKLAALSAVKSLGTKKESPEACKALKPSSNE